MPFVLHIVTVLCDKYFVPRTLQQGYRLCIGTTKRHTTPNHWATRGCSIITTAAQKRVPFFDHGTMKKKRDPSDMFGARGSWLCFQTISKRGHNYELWESQWEKVLFSNSIPPFLPPIFSLLAIFICATTLSSVARERFMEAARTWNALSLTTAYYWWDFFPNTPASALHFVRSTIRMNSWLQTAERPVPWADCTGTWGLIPARIRSQNRKTWAIFAAVRQPIAAVVYVLCALSMLFLVLAVLCPLCMLPQASLAMVTFWWSSMQQARSVDWFMFCIGKGNDTCRWI